MIIAVDFDGTIVEHKYPAIGKEIPFAFETLRKLQTEHHKLTYGVCERASFWMRLSPFAESGAWSFTP